MPMPTFEAKLLNAVVEVATKTEAVEVAVVHDCPLTAKSQLGEVVPTPTFPVLRTVKRVVVAKPAVEEETMKRLGGGGRPPELVVVELA